MIDLVTFRHSLVYGTPKIGNLNTSKDNPFRMLHRNFLHIGPCLYAFNYQLRMGLKELLRTREESRLASPKSRFCTLYPKMPNGPDAIHFANENGKTNGEIIYGYLQPYICSVYNMHPPTSSGAGSSNM